MPTKNTLTEREQYLLKLAARAGGVPDWRLLYICTREKPVTKNLLSLNTSVSNWKNNQLVKSFYQDEIKRFQAEQQQRNGSGGTAEGGHNSSGTAVAGLDIDKINFQDRGEYIAYLEYQIKTAADDKTRLDYIKLLSDAQQYKKPENSDSGPEYMRFYTPVRCQECALYKAKQEEIKTDF